MEITQKEWKNYVAMLSKVNKKAVDEFRDFTIRNGGYEHIKRQTLIDYAYGLATKYGEASAAISAEMYDAMAALQGAAVPAAVPAATAEYSEVCKTVNGIIKNTGNEEILAQGVGRLVKMASADTMLQNANRDKTIKGKYSKRRKTGAEFAWIPSGDTCPYCIMLAAGGWKKQTEWGANSHADHIHANCDCTYAVRFRPDFDVEGYDPAEYEAMYKAGEDVPYENENNSHPDDETLRTKRLNGMRRKAYAETQKEVANLSEEAQSRILNSSAASEIKLP